MGFNSGFKGLTLSHIESFKARLYSVDFQESCTLGGEPQNIETYKYFHPGYALCEISTEGRRIQTQHHAPSAFICRVDTACMQGVYFRQTKL